jgi:hypothetical protein
MVAMTAVPGSCVSRTPVNVNEPWALLVVEGSVVSQLPFLLVSRQTCAVGPPSTVPLIETGTAGGGGVLAGESPDPPPPQAARANVVNVNNRRVSANLDDVNRIFSPSNYCLQHAGDSGHPVFFAADFFSQPGQP